MHEIIPPLVLQSDQVVFALRWRVGLEDAEQPAGLAESRSGLVGVSPLRHLLPPEAGHAPLT